METFGATVTDYFGLLLRGWIDGEVRVCGGARALGL